MYAMCSSNKRDVQISMRSISMRSNSGYHSYNAFAAPTICTLVWPPHSISLHLFPPSAPPLTIVQDYLYSEIRYRNDLIVSLRFG